MLLVLLGYFYAHLKEVGLMKITTAHGSKKTPHHSFIYDISFMFKLFFEKAKVGKSFW
jgi:hypothetical protein